MKKILTYLFILFTPILSHAQRVIDLDKTVNELLKDPYFKHASLSVSVYNINKNTFVYTMDGQRGLLPASMAKIFTTAAGFDKLGSNFRFKTTIGYTGNVDDNGVLHGNIYIVGGGDPLLGSYRYKQTRPDTLFRAWRQALIQHGITEIDGKVCYDVSIFDKQTIHDSWHWGDIGNYYGTGISGLNFHENMYFAYFNASKKLGHPATIDHIEPKNLNINNQNEVVTGPENSGDNVIIYGDPDNVMRHYRGTVPMGMKNFAVRGAMPNPGKSCAELFVNYLRNTGFKVPKQVKEVITPNDSLKIILDYYSNSYYVIAQYINLTSNNMYAESIFKYLGYKSYGKGSFDNGSRVIYDFFREHNLEHSGIKVLDGSGLSRQDRVTTDFVCRFLTEISKMDYYSDFLRAMATAGKNGTVKNLLPNLPTNISMKVKSGTMEGIKAYAGYVTTAKGEKLCFSVICNNYDCSAHQMQKKLEKILYKIAVLEG